MILISEWHQFQKAVSISFLPFILCKIEYNYLLKDERVFIWTAVMFESCQKRIWMQLHCRICKTQHNHKKNWRSEHRNKNK